MQVWPNASEFKSECQTGKLEEWKEYREGGKGMHRYERMCLQLQSVTHHQAATVVRRFLFLHGKIPRIINSVAAAAYLTHSASPPQSLTGNPSGESQKEKNKRGKGKKQNKHKILLLGKSWKIHRGWCLIAERSTSWRSQTYRLGADDWVCEGDW